MSDEYYRVKKFNGGAGAILCSYCSVILKEGFALNLHAVEYYKKHSKDFDGLITEEDWASDEPMFCEECKLVLKNENENS